MTSFCREPDVFEVLKKKVFPRLLKDRPARSPVRVWVPGCSTGEESYSLAIALLEFLDTKGVGVPVQVFATNISSPAIEQARAGFYPAGIAATFRRRGCGGSSCRWTAAIKSARPCAMRASSRGRA